MKLKDLFGMEMPPPHEHGTVPYYQHYATFYRRNRRMFLPIIALSLFLIALNAEGGIAVVSSLLHAGVLFVMGMRWQDGLADERRHKTLAWKVETEETVSGMAQSGLYSSPVEILETLRNGPPAPGFKRKEWIKMHDEAMDDLRKQIEGL